MRAKASNGVRLAVTETGSAAGEPVLLIPGLGMPGWLWPRSFTGCLAKRGYRVVVIENRDSGNSPYMEGKVGMPTLLASIFKDLLRLRVEAPYDLEDMARDALCTADDLGLERFHVGGISMGGMVAQELCRLAPDRVASLTSISSATGNPRTGLGRLSAVSAVVFSSPGADSEREAARSMDRLLGAIGSPEFPRTEQEKQAILERQTPGDRAQEGMRRQLLAILKSGDRGPAVSQIRTPTLVLHGSRDPLLPPEAGRETARLIPGAKLLMVSGMGHDFPEALGARLGTAMADHMAAHPISKRSA